VFFKKKILLIFYKNTLNGQGNTTVVE